MLWKKLTANGEVGQTRRRLTGTALTQSGIAGSGISKLKRYVFRGRWLKIVLFYRNLEITISKLDLNDIPEINADIDRIEEILNKKFLEVTGEKNVVRGKRK